MQARKKYILFCWLWKDVLIVAINFDLALINIINYIWFWAEDRCILWKTITKQVSSTQNFM